MTRPNGMPAELDQPQGYYDKDGRRIPEIDGEPAPWLMNLATAPRSSASKSAPEPR